MVRERAFLNSLIFEEDSYYLRNDIMYPIRSDGFSLIILIIIRLKIGLTCVDKYYKSSTFSSGFFTGLVAEKLSPSSLSLLKDLDPKVTVCFIYS